MSNIGIWQLLLVLLIVLALFGTSKIKNIGSDLGSAIKGFRSAFDKDENDKETPPPSEDKTPETGDKSH